MTIHLHQGDLPDGIDWGDAVAIDSETMGLIPGRDRLCLVQLSAGDGDAHLVQFRRPASADLPDYSAPNLRRLLTDGGVTKIFHYGRFDIAVVQHYMGVVCTPVYCTKIASRLVRTYTDRHGLKDICNELLGVQLQKEQQSSDWGAETLSDAQCAYAAADVLHLHRLRAELDRRLAREGRTALAAACFEFLPTRAALDLEGWSDVDIFAHS
ncbi:MAG: ribonuclease D [Alphaproteobacteria bacterium]|nr:ribonuclease D [Alphaproteobacteria bacterium]MCB9930672.1 ribonuclease D [Alphaproteobacteria bacterium]